MGGSPVGYLHDAVEKLNSGQPRTNPASGRIKDLNLGPPDFKSSALNHSTTLPPFVFADLMTNGRIIAVSGFLRETRSRARAKHENLSV